MDNQVITSETLKPTPVVEVPTAPTPTPEAPALATQNLANKAIETFDLTQKEQQAVAGQENLVSKMLSNIEGLSGESAYRTQVTEQSNIGKFRQELGDLNSQILQKQAEIQQDDTKLISQMRAEERRDTLLPFAQNAQAKLAGDAQIMRALKTSEIGVLNALALGKQGNIELARSTIDEAVNAKFAPYREQISIGKAQLEALTPLLSAAEKKQAQAQQMKANLALKEIEKVSDFQKTALNNAIASNAPASVLDAISRAGSIKEIASVGGNYLQSPADKLDLAIKRAQLSKLQKESVSTPSGGKIVNINGTDYIQNSDGSFSLPSLPGQKDENLTKRVGLEQKLNLFDTILNSSGLSARVGTTALSRKSSFGEKVKAIVGSTLVGAAAGAPLGGVGAVPGAIIGGGAGTLKSFGTGIVSDITGSGQDFSGSVQQLTSAETLDQVLNLKAQGGTLGALNETEGGWLRDAATKINNWEVKKDGKGTGVWNIDEASFKREVNRLKELTSKAIEQAGGRILTEEEKRAQFLQDVNAGLMETNNAYAQAGYNL